MFLVKAWTGSYRGPMHRYGSVVGLKNDQINRYVELHAAVWPAILANITDCKIQNYSIYLRKFPDGKHYLFSYFEYVGDDFDADMKRMAEDSEVQRWWDECKPCHEPFEDREEGEWWAGMKEVFHYD